MGLTCVIIDDEENARENLTILLHEFLPNIEIIGEADSVESGTALLENQNPDIVFLDIQLGAKTAFELLDQLSGNNFQLIFVTAFDNYAIKAFELMALDYLLKPIEINKLIKSVEKAKIRAESKHSNIRLESLIQNFKNIPDDKQKIALATSEGYEMIYIDHITYCTADGSYTQFHFINQPTKIVSKNLKYYENLLSEYNFFRSHSSCLVNKSYIQMVGKTQGGFLKMEDGKILPISKSTRLILENQIKSTNKI